MEETKNCRCSKIEGKIINCLEKLFQLNRSMLWKVSIREGLSPLQIQILIYISEHQSKFNRVAVIARELELAKPTISVTIATLEQKKLVKKVKDPKDRRANNLELSKRGKKIAQSLKTWNESLFDQLQLTDESEKQAGFKFLAHLINSLHSSGEISIVKMCYSCQNYCPTDNPGLHYCKLTKKYYPDHEVNIECSGYSINPNP